MHGNALQKIAPAEKASLRRMGENHFARTEALPLRNARFVEIEQAGLGAGDEQAVVRQRVAKRAQAVAVELAADKITVGENQRRRPVPRLAVQRKRCQSRAHVPRIQRIVLERWGNQREQRLLDRKTLEQLEFERVVQTGGVTDVVFENAKPSANIERSPHLRGFRAQPAAIRDDGIDLAVVRHVTKRLRELPRWLRIGRIALMKNGERRRERRIAQIAVEARELPRREQPLVHYRARRKRTDVATRRQQRLGAFAKQRQPALETGATAVRMKRFHKELPELRHGVQSQTSEAGRFRGHAAPPDNAKAFERRGVFDGSARLLLRACREKTKAQAKCFRELNSLLVGARAEERLRQREQQARAVAARSVRIDATAMRQPFESGEPIFDDFVTGRTTQVRDEAGSTRIVVGMPPVGVTSHACL